MVSVYTTPPGWYPDPSGEPRWRVWNGLDWSDVTRDYAGGDVDATPWPVALAVHRVARYGVAGVFAGLGLAVSVGAHWPGSAHPLNAVVAPTLLAVALTM
ncbi:MAG: DUF2510 domain-containing protein, partial [Acidimicrobiales bacterium]